MAKKSKYGNTPCHLGGVRFASRRERDAYIKLDALAQAGAIRDLRLQVRYPLIVGGSTVCTYIADFVFLDVKSGKEIVADAKGYRTDVYMIKKKLMRAIHGIEIVEL